MMGENNQATECAINIYCDNKSLINRINNRCNVRMTVNQHRDAEVDLELQVLNEIEPLEKQNTMVRMNYVKGHIIMQIVFVNKHICYLTQNEYYSILANKVNLILDERVITAHAPKAMAKAYHSINISNYYREKHHWIGTTVRLIWWKAYGKSLINLSQPEKLKVQNFINNWMTNKRFHKYSSDHSGK
jgi:hypothetical protein